MFIVHLYLFYVLKSFILKLLWVRWGFWNSLTFQYCLFGQYYWRDSDVAWLWDGAAWSRRVPISSVRWSARSCEAASSRDVMSPTSHHHSLPPALPHSGRTDHTRSRCRDICLCTCCIRSVSVGFSELLMIMLHVPAAASKKRTTEESHLSAGSKRRFTVLGILSQPSLWSILLLASDSQS